MKINDLITYNHVEEIQQTLDSMKDPYDKSIISILATCKDFDTFYKFYDNFLKTCSDFSLIEILIKMESGAEADKVSYFLYNNNIKYKIIIYSHYTPRHSFHHYYNDLYKISSGDLIFGVAMDLVNVHGDWLKSFIDINNRMKSKYPDGIYSFSIPMDNGLKGKHIAAGQIVTRKWVDVLGFYSPFPNMDRWLYRLSIAINRYEVVDEKEALFHYPPGSRTFCKKDKKYLFAPTLDHAVEIFKKHINT